MGILRDLFGPSRDEIWSQFAAAVGGDFQAGGFWKGSRVDAKHGEWTVTLDTYTVSNGKTSTTYTRMRAPYVNPSGFRFKIYRQGVFSTIGKWFGMQDIQVGEPAFDEAFIIQANDEAAVQQLLANDKIRELAAVQPDIFFCVKDDENNFWTGLKFPPDTDELYFQVTGVIRDAERLRLLYELFAATLDELCHLGAAYQSRPAVRL